MHGLSDKVLLNLPDTVLCSAAGTAAPIACLPSFLDRFAGGIVGSVSHVQVCTAPHACRAPKPQLRPQATSMAEEDIWVTTTHDSLSRSPARPSPHTAASTGRPSSIPPHATCVIVFRLHHEETASGASFQDIQQDHFHSFFDPTAKRAQEPRETRVLSVA